jgi:hypothetical protein
MFLDDEPMETPVETIAELSNIKDFWPHSVLSAYKYSSIHLMDALDALSLEKITGFMPLSDLANLALADPAYKKYFEERLSNADNLLHSLVSLLLNDPNRIALMIKSSTEEHANVLYMLSAEKLTRENNRPVMRETKWLEHADFRATETNGWIQAQMIDDDGNPIESPMHQIEHFIHRSNIDTRKAVGRTIAFWRDHPSCSVSIELAYVSKHYVKHRQPVPLLDGWSVNLDRYFYDYYDLKIMSYYYTETKDIKVMKETKEASPLADFEGLCAAVYGERSMKT